MEGKNGEEGEQGWGGSLNLTSAACTALPSGLFCAERRSTSKAGASHLPLSPRSTQDAGRTQVFGLSTFYRSHAYSHCPIPLSLRLAFPSPEGMRERLPGQPCQIIVRMPHAVASQSPYSCRIRAGTVATAVPSDHHPCAGVAVALVPDRARRCSTCSRMCHVPSAETPRHARPGASLHLFVALARLMLAS